MVEHVSAVAVGTVILTLLTAAGEHLLRPAGLIQALRAHRVFPAAAAVAAAVTTCEAALGVAGGYALAVGHSALLTAVLVGSAVLFTGYGSYSWHVRASARTGSCGCSQAAPTPTTGWVVARAFVLSGVALSSLAVLAGAGTTLAGAAVTAFDGPRLAATLLAAATFTVLLWSLPAAMWDPSRERQGRGAGGMSSAGSQPAGLGGGR
ncbi:MAG: MauE/DoxX family redox-associated membrane protein [Micromonosporaceae bacterium]